MKARYTVVERSDRDGMCYYKDTLTGSRCSLPGDALFILGGTLPIHYLCWLGVARMKIQTPREEPDGVLFAEIQETKVFGGK